MWRSLLAGHKGTTDFTDYLFLRVVVKGGASFCVLYRRTCQCDSATQRLWVYSEYSSDGVQV